jgi:hypothetical protein
MKRVGEMALGLIGIFILKKNNMNIKNLLGQNSHWQVNKELARKIGIEPALLLSEIIDSYDYFKERNELVKYDGVLYYFQTSEKIQEKTSLSYKKQKSCIDVLLKHGFIKTTLKGIPAKLHFSVCEDKILHFFNLRIDKGEGAVLPKGKNLNDSNVESIYKENIIKKEDKKNNIKKRKTATIDDVIAVLPPNSEQLIPCLREWMEYKLARGESYLLSTISTTVNKLLKGCEGNAAILQAMVDKSIASNYSGMFALPAFEVKRILESGEKKSLPFPLEVKRKDMITNKWVMEEFGMDIRSIFKENGFQENHEYCKFIREHLEDKYSRPKGILFDSEEYHRDVNNL